VCVRVYAANGGGYCRPRRPATGGRVGGRRRLMLLCWVFRASILVYTGERNFIVPDLTSDTHIVLRLLCFALYISLRLPYDCPVIALRLPCTFSRAHILLPCICPVSVLPLPCDCPALALRLPCSCPALALPLPCPCPALALPLLCYYSVIILTWFSCCIVSGFSSRARLDVTGTQDITRQGPRPGVVWYWPSRYRSSWSVLVS